MAARMRKLFRFLLIALVGGGILTQAALTWMRQELDAPLLVGGTQHFEVRAGASAAGVARQLATNGWLASPRVWTWYARWTGKADQLKDGYYEISTGESGRTLLDEIAAGRVMLEQITVIEGWAYRDLRRLLAGQRGVRQTLHGVSDAALMARLGAPGVHPEGQFFPDTYRFAYGSADIDVLRTAHERM